MNGSRMLRRRGLGIGAAAVVIGVSGCSASAPADHVVKIYGGLSGEAAKYLQADLDDWSKTSGVKVKYDGSPDFLTIIVSQVSAGNPPDIVINPVPGLVKDQSKDMYPLDELGIDVKAVTADEANGVGNLGTFDGKTYGLPMELNVKSVVWYNPAAFAKAGLTVPTTDAELQATEKQIVDKGLGYPWCLGLEDGNSTGWVVTDWLEEYVLRYGGLDEYKKWVDHTIPFSSPLLDKVGNRVADTLLAPGQVNGGGVAAATTNFGTAGNQLFADGKANGQCFMMRQGSFVADYFPDDIKAQIAKGDFANIDFFHLPSPDNGESAMLGGGDLVGAFSKDDNTKKVVEYLVSKDFGTHGFAKNARGFLSPHADFDSSQYGTKLQAKAQDLLKQSKVFAFDGSDQMPAVIGAGTGLAILTQWFTGQLTMKDAFAQIDAVWPKDGK